MEGKWINGTVSIDGDNDLEGFIMNIGCPGNGSISNPYQIESYTFNGTGNYHGLEIWSTSRHLVLSNCTFIGSGYVDYGYAMGRAIQIVESSNVTMERCVIRDNVNTGIACIRSSVVIDENLVFDNGGTGIEADDCTGSISNNTAYGNGVYGISQTGDDILVGNTLLHNVFYADRQIHDSNTVNGRPMLVLNGDVNGTYSEDVSQVVMIGCSGTILSGMDFDNVSVAIVSDGGITIDDCSFTDCDRGADLVGEKMVKSSSFVRCGLGIDAYDYEYGSFCDGNRFIDCGTGIESYRYCNITDNFFKSTGSYAICTTDYGWVLPSNISGNVIIDTGKIAISMRDQWGPYIPTIIMGNRIAGSGIGLDLFGNFNVTDNIISGCTDSSIMIYGSILLHNNTMFGPGIDVRELADINEDNTSTVNGVPISVLVSKRNVVLDRDTSQLILIDCQSIEVRNITVMTEPFAIVLDHCWDISIINCTIMDIDVGDRYSKNTVLNGSSVFGKIHGIDAAVKAYRTNFYLYPLAYNESWGYGTSYPLDFDDNYYREFSEWILPIGTSSDGVHWDDRYHLIAQVEDLHPRVLPFGYSGPMDPAILSDLTPQEVDEGSILNISVEVWDPIWTGEAWVDISIDGRPVRLNLSRGGGWNWSGSIDVPMNTTSLDYSIHARSVIGRWVNSTRREVAVNDVLGPSLTDLTDRRGSTGDPFMFRVLVSDNHGLSRTWVEYYLGEDPSTILELTPENHYTAFINLPWDRIDLLSYMILAVDHSGNEATVGRYDVPVRDDDPPDAVLPYMVEAIAGENVQMTGIASTDNIGIVRYDWFFEGSREIAHSGMNWTYDFAYPGMYRVFLEVKDGGGLTDLAGMFIRVNESGYNFPPVRVLDLSIGPILDNHTGDPIEGVIVFLSCEDIGLFNSTGRDGIAYFTLNIRETEAEALLLLVKEGYRNLTIRTMLEAEGVLAIGSARMDPIPDEEQEPPVEEPEPEGPDPQPFDPLVLIVTMIILSGALLVLALWLLLKRRTWEIVPEE